MLLSAACLVQEEIGTSSACCRCSFPRYQLILCTRLCVHDSRHASHNGSRKSHVFISSHTSLFFSFLPSPDRPSPLPDLPSSPDLPFPRTPPPQDAPPPYRPTFRAFFLPPQISFFPLSLWVSSRGIVASVPRLHCHLEGVVVSQWLRPDGSHHVDTGDVAGGLAACSSTACVGQARHEHIRDMADFRTEAVEVANVFLLEASFGTSAAACC